MQKLPQLPQMMTGSKGYCDLFITISENGMKLLEATGIKDILPKTEIEKIQGSKILKYKISNGQASFMAMWHLSEIYGITININPETMTTNMTSKRTQLDDNSIEKICSMFIVYEKENLSEERKKFWNSQLVLGNLLLKTFNKWNAWRTITAMYLMNYYPPLQLKLLSNITQIDTAIEFSEAERIFNIINDKKLGTVQGYKR